MHKFTESELTEISNAVKNAEKKTSGEIVPFITAKAEDYFDGAASFVFIAILLTAMLYFYYQPWHSVRGLLLAELGGLLLGLISVNLFPKTRLWFISKNHIAQSTRRRAIQAFYEQGLSNTRDKTGILIALFFLEKKVEIVADEGINNKLEQKIWDNVVKTIIQGAKNHKLSTGFIAGINLCGDILKQHFPRKKDDTNELKNNLVID